MRLFKITEMRPLAEYGREVIFAGPDIERSAQCRAMWTREPLNAENIDAAIERSQKALKDNPRSGHPVGTDRP